MTASARYELHADGLPMPRRAFAAATVMMGLGMSVLDSAVANVALPTIADEMGVDPASSVWVINAYQLAIVACLFPVAALGERLGYRRVYLVGMGVFALGSLCCVLSHSLWQLVGSRVLQGIGASGLMALSSALTRFNYPGRLLGQGFGYNAVVIATCAAAGPTVASLILSVASWQWIFAVNLPIAAAAIIVGVRALPLTPGRAKPVDIPSAVLNIIAFGGLIFGAESLAREGSPLGFCALAAGAVAFVLLIRREWSQPAPLVPLDLLRIPIFALSVVASVCSFVAQMLTYVALPFYFQHALGKTAVETGLLITPWPIAVGVVAPIAGRMSDRYPAGGMGAIGMVVFAIGLVLLSRVGPDASDLDIAWRMFVTGAGFAFFQSPNNRTMVAAAPKERAGAAGGMLATARVTGQTAGALTMAVFFHLGGVGIVPSALILASVLALIGGAVSLTRLRLPRPPALGGAVETDQ